MLVGTWNLENLYRPGSPFGPRDKAAYEAKLAALAATVNRLRPTLLGVQEVGDPAALDDLVQMLDGQYFVTLSEFPDERGIRVGFVSDVVLNVVADTPAFPDRLRPVQVDDSGRTTDRAGRGVLAAHFSTRATWLTAAVCHLKSKLLSYPGGRFQPHDESERARYGAYALQRRAAEAATVRALADVLVGEDGRHERVAVLGDFNDDTSAATTQILHGPPGSEIGTPGFDRPDRGDAKRLWNVAPLIPADQRYSRIQAGRRELIDHVFVTHELVGRISRAGTGVPAEEGAERPPLPSVGENPHDRRDATASDHAPVWIELRP
ncbi:endonuclease/exonuclease/phosphatase family protein [Streptomyces sp. VRA16 Mangrove soil]|uniref:endonuclease/exonuclease/phosphatase family protein n=1 Tax=Streptomyces sp. VRA16 Mangrove soil TaxID=2817434 RepID=UPI001A9DA001|nr:endonuclease/exonuclease/phosphatase family protein [Streptomyces sp. VRA16 Mangrove soil]MBO1335376.1 endonuclease/exonuclease/phosphatase family protein [Streptomyces sp. VRA16 Mangrove soil]